MTKIWVLGDEDDRISGKPSNRARLKVFPVLENTCWKIGGSSYCQDSRSRAAVAQEARSACRSVLGRHAEPEIAQSDVRVCATG